MRQNILSVIAVSLALSLSSGVRASPAAEAVKSVSDADNTGSLRLPPPLPPTAASKARKPPLLPPLPAGIPVVGRASAPLAGTSSAIDASRKRAECTLAGKKLSSFDVGASAIDLDVNFLRSQGLPCLMAASADESWVDAGLDSAADQVVLHVGANALDVARTAVVYVLTGSQTFQLRVRQAASEKKVD